MTPPPPAPRLPLVLLCLLRNLRLLAPVTTLATMAEGWALAVVFYYLFCEPLPDVSSRPLVEGLGVTLSSVYLYKFFQENFPSSLARLYLPLRESALCFL